MTRTYNGEDLSRVSDAELEEAEQMALKRTASEFLNWDDPKEHSFNPIHKRPPLTDESKTLKVEWSADREQKRAAIGFVIVLILVVVLLGLFVKTSNNMCVFTGPNGECVNN